MHYTQALKAACTPRSIRLVPIPSRALEYTFYLAVAYSVLGEVLGLSIPLLAGGMFLGLAAACLARVQTRLTVVYGPLAWLIACAIVFVFIQVGVHGESAAESGLRAFINWIFGLLIVYSLSLRPGFSRRFPCVLFLIGIVVLPYMALGMGDIQRARIDLPIGGSLSHAGGLAEWFGFCTVYLVVAGTQSRSHFIRVAAFSVAIGCLFVVVLTVSRGVLLATALATVVALRRLLKRGFIPLFVVFVLAGIVYESGVFDAPASQYSVRGAEKSGRELLWPAAIQRIISAPTVGVGLSNVGMSVLAPNQLNPPHNSFLWFALASGLLPFYFYVAFWIRATKRSLADPDTTGDGPFRLPYLLFTFTCVMLGDSGFMSFWALLTLSVGAGKPMWTHHRRRIIVATVSPGRWHVPVPHTQSVLHVEAHRVHEHIDRSQSGTGL